jgi:hypothetical protein
MPLRAMQTPGGAEHLSPALFEQEFREVGLLHGFRGKTPVWEAATEEGDPEALRLVADALEPLDVDEIGVGD